MSPALAGGFLTTVPPGKSLCKIFKKESLRVEDFKEDFKEVFKNMKEFQKYNFLNIWIFKLNFFVEYILNNLKDT